MFQDLETLLFDIFSTRELALFSWLFLLIIFMVSNKNLRGCLGGLLRAFFNKKLFSVFLILLIYVALVVLILFRSRIWDMTLLKDTCFWFISSATVVFFNINKAKSIRFFKDLIVENLKMVIILEYLLNFYTFRFGIEFCLLPVTVFISILYAFSELPSQQKEKNSKKVTSLFKGILVIIGLIMISYALYKTIIGYKDLMTISNLKALLLPLILTILTIPYFYFLALLMEYETVFVSIDCFFKNKDSHMRRKVKFQIIRFANINLNRINKVHGRKLSKIAYFEGNLDNHLKRFFEKPLHKRTMIGSKTKIQLFNDIEKARLLFSQMEIGNLNEWEWSYENEFISYTPYFTIDYCDLNPPVYLQNVISFSLLGSELYVSRLELSLNLNYVNDKEKMLSLFKELIKKTFNVLELDFSFLSFKHINKKAETIFENDIFSCKLNFNSNEITEDWKLIIETKFNI